MKSPGEKSSLPNHFPLANHLDSKNWIQGQEELSQSAGLKITKLILSAEALEMLNAHVPEFGPIR